MKTAQSFIAILVLVLVCIPAFPAKGIDTRDTKLLSEPAMSDQYIAFVYAGDLWIAEPDGQNVRRLTSDEGVESGPVFTRDGKWIVFNAQYDGNTDVYAIPVEGGIPKRLTWHPGTDQVCDVTPDGSAVLFRSGRSVFTNRYTQLFTVPLEGGFPEKLPLPNAHHACYSPDGKYLAYTPLYEPFRQWKNYRGGTVSTIRIYRFEDHSIEKIPQPEGRCNDTSPMWIEDAVYFLSDRNGEFNLFSYEIGTGSISQHTRFEDFPILNASKSGSKIIFEQAGRLHVYDLALGQSDKLTIGIGTDLPELRPRYVKGARYIRNASVSPSGARAAFEFRGEIVTVPAEKGDPRNITLSPGAHERSPAWSPDGKRIAFFSDASGEYALHVALQDGKGETRAYPLSGTGFYNAPIWSPDGGKITFADNARNLYWMELESGKITKIASETVYLPGAFGTIRGVWSPDSKWIAYTVHTKANIQTVYVHSLDQNRSFAITDGLSEVSEPVFDESGKYMYFFASTDAGPVKHWFAMSSADMEMSNAIYLVTLQEEVVSPFAKESDEEEGAGKKADNKDEKSKKDEKAGTKKPREHFRIDFDGIHSRILAFPVKSGNLSSLQAGDEGQIYYLERAGDAGGRENKLHRYDLKARKDEVLATGISHYSLSADKKKILSLMGGSWHITPAGKFTAADGKLNTEAIEIRIDPIREWAQIYDEAWRINRDYFYADNMHGADWVAMKEKYAAFLPQVSCRNDLNRVIQWLCSELAVGHHRVGGGDFLHQPRRIQGGLLGADYKIENGRYRFEKVYGGLNWNPELRSPLTEPGVDVKAGEYLLEVNGRELDASVNLFSLFENTADKIVEIRVGPNPDFRGSRVVRTVPVAGEYALRNRDWVEGNIRKVDEATGGQVAYVYVPNTTRLGHTYFKRYFFPQTHKHAIIVDERFNGGGLIADYYIDILRRPFASYWNMRYGGDYKTPSGSIQGPRVMLIDETAGSGGDMLPWMWRKFGMGKLIGKRTWGGLVGTLGFPVLMDGGYVTAPNLAIWTEDGWVVENEGVPPDIEVEQLPAEVIAGRDPQLEKAIEVILKELEKNPPVKPERPPYPVRVRK